MLAIHRMIYLESNQGHLLITITLLAAAKKQSVYYGCRWSEVYTILTGVCKPSTSRFSHQNVIDYMYILSTRKHVDQHARI